MATRREAREYALQVLYAWDLTRLPIDHLLRFFWLTRKEQENTINYVENLVRSVLFDVEKIDTMIESKSKHWKLARMSFVDRNILRLAVGEFLAGNVPPLVVINEAIEIAKRYGDGESGQFVNGILDAIHQNMHTRNAQA